MAEHTLQSIAFPVLDENQIIQLANCATVALKQFRDGETLIHVGDRLFKFFVVQSGEIEILDYSGDAPKTLTVHRKGQFTGDISHLTGAPAIITAVTQGDCQAYEVSGEALRHVLNQCPGLSDIILQAFIARRQLLRESANFIGLRVIGSRYSPDTFRVRDFLARNRVLFTWVDLESDPQVDRLLKEFYREGVICGAHLTEMPQPALIGSPGVEIVWRFAHRSLPLGTVLCVENLDNRRTILVRINDRGPFFPGRIVDLSREAARQPSRYKRTPVLQGRPRDYRRERAPRQLAD